MIGDLVCKKLGKALTSSSFSGDIYGETEGMKIHLVSHLPSKGTIFNTYLRLRVLDGCCGVVEVIRPRDGCATQVNFNMVMNAVVGAIREWNRLARKNFQSEIGNQLLCTTSSESDEKFVPWLTSIGAAAFPPARNPRTGRMVTIWRVKV
jgi:hypothetical protein